MSVYVLDACAVIAFFNDEAGADCVEKILQSESVIWMSSVNILEVCYDCMRYTGNQEDGHKILSTIKKLPIQIVSELSDEILLTSAKFKSIHKISLADSIALGLSKVKNAQLVTADHHEFDILEKTGLAQFKWIR